jgi:hypothetical protein
MTMALPSNLFFLGSLTIFTIMVGWFESGGSRFSIKRLLWVVIPQLIMFALIAVYFLVIYEQLKYGKNLQPQSLDGTRIFEIAELLVAPWGFCVYFFFTIGAWRLRGTREKIVFGSVFFIPMILTVITGVVGYARIYIYWLPFIIFLSAYGMTEVIFWLKKKTGNLVYGVGVGVVFFLVFLLTNFFSR